MNNRKSNLSTDENKFALSNVEHKKVKMKFDKKQIDDIMGNNEMIVVFGLTSCKYLKLAKAMVSSGIDVKIHNNYPEYMHNNRRENYDCKKDHEDRYGWKLSDVGYKPSRRCKSVLTLHIMNNYQRLLHGLPVIPLLFCIELVEGTHHESLDILKTINGCYGSDNATNAEIKRIYKIYNEKPELQEVIDSTFHFIRLTQDYTVEEGFYRIEKIAAPWTSEIWKTEWDRYRALPNPRPTRYKCDWRDAVKNNLLMFKAEVQTPNDNISIQLTKK